MIDDFDSDDDDDWPDDVDDEMEIECPECGASIYEDAPQCPVCGHYLLSQSGLVWDGKPTWYVILGLLGILAVILGGLTMWF